MKRIILAAAVLVVLAGAGYLLVRESVSATATTQAPNVIQKVVVTGPEDPPATDAAAGAAAEPALLSLGEPGPQPIQPLPYGSAGTVRKVTSIDFNRHLVSMAAGEAGLRGDGRIISMLQQRYDLDEQELQKFLEYSIFALQSDREYQRELQQQTCDRRAEFQSLHSFGLALNDLDRKAEEHQEYLGRQAEQALGTVLFSKINNVILREPPNELAITDFPVLLAGRDEDLHQQITRFCSILE